jgi:cytochrome c oxidase assembly protein subunit 15
MEALERGRQYVKDGALGSADIIALGFGTATAMWAAGYLTHLPGVDLPQPLVLAILAAVLLGGGYLAGRYTARGWLGGLYTGLIAGLINLLILGSVVGKQLSSGGASGAGTALLVSVVASALLGAAAAAAGRSRHDPAMPQPDWTHGFARIAAAATLLLIFAGGLVTSHEAGLAVPDWPQTFGNNMFLFPLADMTGGVYYEHAHRLLGTLVGLTTLTLMVHLLRGPWRRKVKLLSVLVFVLVCVQGVIGGMRVTDKSVALAVVHGITAQLIFAILAGLVVLTARSFRSLYPADETPQLASERRLAKWVVGLLVVQLIVGTLFRHKNDVLSHYLYLHIMLAVGIVIAAVVTGLRASNYRSVCPGYARTGKSLLHTVGLQFILGATAFIVLAAAGQTAPAATVVATLHQTVGALLLATGVSLQFWSAKLQPTADGEEGQ